MINVNLDANKKVDSRTIRTVIICCVIIVFIGFIVFINITKHQQLIEFGPAKWHDTAQQKQYLAKEKDTFQVIQQNHSVKIDKMSGDIIQDNASKNIYNNESSRKK